MNGTSVGLKRAGGVATRVSAGAKRTGAATTGKSVGASGAGKVGKGKTVGANRTGTAATGQTIGSSRAAKIATGTTTGTNQTGTSATGATTGAGRAGTAATGKPMVASGAGNMATGIASGANKASNTRKAARRSIDGSNAGKGVDSKATSNRKTGSSQLTNYSALSDSIAAGKASNDTAVNNFIEDPAEKQYSMAAIREDSIVPAVEQGQLQHNVSFDEFEKDGTQDQNPESGFGTDREQAERPFYTPTQFQEANLAVYESEITPAVQSAGLERAPSLDEFEMLEQDLNANKQHVADGNGNMHSNFSDSNGQQQLQNGRYEVDESVIIAAEENQGLERAPSLDEFEIFERDAIMSEQSESIDRIQRTNAAKMDRANEEDAILPDLQESKNNYGTLHTKERRSSTKAVVDGGGKKISKVERGAPINIQVVIEKRQMSDSNTAIDGNKKQSSLSNIDEHLSSQQQYREYDEPLMADTSSSSTESYYTPPQFQGDELYQTEKQHISMNTKTNATVHSPIENTRMADGNILAQKPHAGNTSGRRRSVVNIRVVNGDTHVE